MEDEVDEIEWPWYMSLLFFMIAPINYTMELRKKREASIPLHIRVRTMPMAQRKRLPSHVWQELLEMHPETIYFIPEDVLTLNFLVEAMRRCKGDKLEFFRTHVYGKNQLSVQNWRHFLRLFPELMHLNSVPNELIFSEVYIQGWILYVGHLDALQSQRNRSVVVDRALTREEQKNEIRVREHEQRT